MLYVLSDYIVSSFDSYICSSKEIPIPICSDFNKTLLDADD